MLRDHAFGLNPILELDFLTPSRRGFEPKSMDYVCHWIVDKTPQALSEAMRRLLQRADTDLVLFVGDDIEFGPEHVKILLGRMGPGIGAVESNPQIPGFHVNRSRESYETLDTAKTKSYQRVEPSSAHEVRGLASPQARNAKRVQVDQGAELRRGAPRRRQGFSWTPKPPLGRWS